LVFVLAIVYYVEATCTYGDWMTGCHTLEGKKLNQMFFPGSHDAMIWTLDNIPSGKQKYYITQKGDFTYQLCNGGARMFDVRVQKYSGKGNAFYGVHPLMYKVMGLFADPGYSVPFGNVIFQVADFLKDHKGEFVILRIKLPGGQTEAAAFLTDLKTFVTNSDHKIDDKIYVATATALQSQTYENLKGKLILLNYEWTVPETVKDVHDYWSVRFTDYTSAFSGKFSSSGKTKTVLKKQQKALDNHVAGASDKVFGAWITWTGGNIEETFVAKTQKHEDDLFAFFKNQDQEAQWFEAPYKPSVCWTDFAGEWDAPMALVTEYCGGTALNYQLLNEDDIDFFDVDNEDEMNEALVPLLKDKGMLVELKNKKKASNVLQQ